MSRAIVLTPPGLAAISVLRLIGPQVSGFLLEHFSKPAPTGRCVHGTLTDGSQIIDDPVVLRIDSEKADINLHGGTWVIQSALNLTRRDGFEIVEASTAPLPLDATDGPGIVWREVQAWLPMARTRQSIQALLAQPALWDKLLALPDAASQLPDILSDRALRTLLSLPIVAVVGPANVGKSTLANQLFGQERSITADQPGTTRDWVGEIANIDGLAVMLVDTPGRRSTDDSIEQAAIAASQSQSRAADLVLIVFDQSQVWPTEANQLMTEYPKHLLVANKSDQPAACENPAAIKTMALNDSGTAQLRQSIRHFFGVDRPADDRPSIWTKRQEQVVHRALQSEGSLREILENEM